MAQFLRDPQVLQADIIAIQEPWRNPFQDTSHHPANQTHQLLYPTANDIGTDRARVCLYISRRIDPRTWKHTVHSRDCQEIEIQHKRGRLRIINIYNPGPWDRTATSDTIDLLDRIVDRQSQEYIILGDFNLHHPAWCDPDARDTLGTRGHIDTDTESIRTDIQPHVGPPPEPGLEELDRYDPELELTPEERRTRGPNRRVRQDPSADKLLELTDSRLLDLWLEPGTITRESKDHRTTIDLVWGSQSLTDRFIACEVAPKIHADSDHLPIRTLIDIDTPEAEVPRRRNWKAMDAAKLRDFVAININPASWTYLDGEPRPEWIDEAADYLIETVQRAIQESTPWARPCARSNPNFTDDCRTMVKLTRLLRRVWVVARTEEAWADYCRTRNRKGKVINKALKRGYRRWIRDTVDQGPRGLWRVAKWARNRGQPGNASVIPTLNGPNGPADSMEAKTEVFRKTFFPAPPPADLTDINPARYPEPIDFPSITEAEVSKAVRRAPPDKAPGPDAIPNKVWHTLIAVPAVLKVVTLLFNACVRTGHNPHHFQSSTTVVLRKPGPRDYRIPKSYRPVALLNTLGKVLESVIATRISWALEEYQILPKTHLGGRKGISTDHAIQLILDRVLSAWGHGLKVSMLLLDVSGAFDNVSHARLINNIYISKLGRFEPWIQSFLTGRSTRLSFTGYVSNIIDTATGIPQGSPLSPILYLLYNTPLIQALAVHRPEGGQAEAFGWIDDACVIAVSQSYADNVATLQKALTKADHWAATHASRFAPDKFELIHFTNPREPDPEQEIAAGA
ncbi:unnamed protein product [Aspergillus oryzae]|nr:unnamed protein product [Aspergillus oryzae]